MTDSNPRHQPEGSGDRPPSGAGSSPEVGSGKTGKTGGTGRTGSPSFLPDRYDGPGILDFLSMGVAAALCLVLGGGAGYLLDAWIGTAPWLTFVGLAFGIVAAVLVTVSQVRKHLS